MSTTERVAGYYWCRDGNDWKIAEWHAGSWHLVSDHHWYSDDIWDEIDPSPIIHKPNDT